MKKRLIIPALAVIALAGCGAASTSTVPPGHEPQPTQDADAVAGSTSKIVWTEGTAKMYEVLIPNGKDIAMRCYVTTFNGHGVSQTCTEVTMR